MVGRTFAGAAAGFSLLMMAGMAPASAQGSQAADILSRLESKGVATSYAQWRGRGYGARGYYGRGHYGRGYYGRRRGVGTGALIGGLAAGALLGGALAAQAAPPPPVYVVPGPGPNAVAYCARRFRSYDPASGTYLGYDGLRHACP